MKSILDPNFTYTPAAEMGEDYLKRKFARIKRELREADRLNAEKMREGASRVHPLAKRKTA